MPPTLQACPPVQNWTINKIMVVVAFALLPSLLVAPFSTVHYQARFVNRMSNFFPSRRGSPAAVFVFQLLICQSIDQCHSFAAVIQGPPHAIEITIFFHKLHRKNFPRAMRRGVLRQPECTRSPLYVFPNSLPGTRLFGVYPLKYPLLPCLLFEIIQQRLR